MSGAVDWLMNLQRFGMKPGQERMHALLEALGRPEAGLRLVLVGGTNGKGSTASMLAAMLSAAGERTGLFTSPHLVNVMERFVVDGRQLPLSRLEQVLELVRPLATDVSATFFEVMVACAWLLFREAGCSTVVLEVGLGGRFDATNASDPALSIITNVDLDHTEVLGKSAALIAADKAHLLRPGRSTITAASGEALTVLRRHAAALGARLHVLDEDFQLHNGRADWSGSELSVSWATDSLALRTPLLGAHQAVNSALAAYAARQLGVEAGAIRTGLSSSRWPGRLEKLTAFGRNWLLDGAHNPAAARALAAALDSLSARPALLILGVTADKDVPGVIRELTGLAPLVIATRAELSPRALMPAQLAELAELAGESALQADNAAAALQLARRLSKPDELIVVAGSLYLLGELRPLLSGQKPEGYERWQ